MEREAKSLLNSFIAPPQIEVFLEGREMVER